MVHVLNLHYLPVGGNVMDVLRELDKVLPLSLAANLSQRLTVHLQHTNYFRHRHYKTVCKTVDRTPSSTNKVNYYCESLNHEGFILANLSQSLEN